MNRKFSFIGLSILMAFSVNGFSQPPRVAVLDFDVASGKEPGTQLPGLVTAQAVAEKGAYVLSELLLKENDFVLVDRRDFTSQLKKISSPETEKHDQQPTFIHAAQMLNVDAILRGTLLVYSTGEKKINQGGHATDLADLSLRISLQALDVIDGSILAMGSGVAREKFRQTTNVKISIGEEQVIQMLEDAVKKAIPAIVEGLSKRLKKNDERQTVLLTVEATENPALVEIDGVLVGSTPMQALQVYSGDHVLSISKPGYETITRRVVFRQDSVIRAPMLKTDLTMEEKKELLEKVDMKVYLTSGRPDILIQKIGE